MSEHLDIAKIDPTGEIRTIAADAGAFDEQVWLAETSCAAVPLRAAA